MKVLQIKGRRLKLFGCSLKLLANVQCTSTRKRSVKLIPTSYFTDSKKKEHKCLKSLQSLFCILHPACVLLSVCSLHFTLSLHFTPGPQSAVCSPQSAFYTDRCLNTFATKIISGIVIEFFLDSKKAVYMSYSIVIIC